VHSAFWAIYNNDINRLGYTVFWVNFGVDSGDIIYQGKIKIDENDSYITAGWKGMELIALKQIEVIFSFNKGIDIPRIPINEIPDNSNYGHPTILQYFSFRRKQNILR
jgi:methionyl-tRNA formyltransferase